MDEKSNRKYGLTLRYGMGGIPKDLLHILFPKNGEELMQFEMNWIKWMARLSERVKVMQLQKHYGLPLHPNQPLKEVVIKIKLLELKEKKKWKDSVDNGSDAAQ